MIAVIPKTWITVAALLLSLLPATLAARESIELEKQLTMRGAKKMAVASVKGLLKDGFFSKLDIPIRVSLSQARLFGERLGFTEDEYTDIILNVILSHPMILVVNQDLRIDMSMDYKLIEYLPELKARRSGLLLGADYILTSSLTETRIVTPKGKPKMQYTARLKLMDIRSTQLFAEYEHLVIKKISKKYLKGAFDD